MTMQLGSALFWGCWLLIALVVGMPRMSGNRQDNLMMCLGLFRIAYYLLILAFILAAIGYIIDGYVL